MDCDAKLAAANKLEAEIGDEATRAIANWRKAFEMIGPAQLRLRLEHRRNEFAPEYAREAERWLLEKDAEAAKVERDRFLIIRRWTIVAAIASVVAAIAAVIAAIK